MSRKWIGKVYSIVLIAMLFLSPLTSLLPSGIIKSAAAEETLAPLTTITDPNQGDNFGMNVSWIGDVNGDGYDDIIVGAPYADRKPLGDWWNSDWAYRRKLTFDNSAQSENLVNFPVLVKLDISNFDFSKAKMDGTDLRFVDDDGITELNYEIESWNSSGKGFIWVNVTRIDGGSNSDYIWMYYGNLSANDSQNPTGVWDSNFKAVYHLNETPTSTVYDSTSNDIDLTPNAFESSGQVSGPINGAINFDDSPERMVSTNTVTIESFTMEAWMSSDDWTTWHTILEVDGEPTGFRDFTIDDTQRISMDNTFNYDITPPLSGSAWHYVVARYDDNAGSNPLRGFINGTITSNTPDPGDLASVTGRVVVGAYWWDGSSIWSDYWDGRLDEIRLSNISRSNDWIRAQYLSTNNSFITYIGEETNIKNAGAAYIFFGYPGINSTNIDISKANVTIYGSNAGDLFGWSVSDAGDMNSDGYDDVIIGAPGWGADRGKAYVFYGRDTASWNNIYDADTEADVIMTGENDGDKFGFSVSGAGDVNYNRYLDDWLYRKKITIMADQIAGDLVDFPILISITDPDLKRNARSDGYDILFRESDGKTKLDHEIEGYDNSTGTLIAWVRIPYLNSTYNTDIYMYYGNQNASDQSNPEGVWDDNYLGVWHGQTTPPGVEFDSTSWGTDLDITQMEPADLIDAKIGKGYDLDGVNERLQSPSGTTVTMESFTFEIWAVSDNWAWDWQTMISVNNDNRQMVILNNRLTFWDGNPHSLSPVLSGTEFKHMAVRYNDSLGSARLRGFVDGLLQPQTSNPNYSPEIDRVRVGCIVFGTPADFFAGKIDEVRISDIPRSNEWIETGYNNQNDTSTFYSIGEEEVLSFYPDWNFRKKITIDSSKVTGNLTNFPVLINITDINLRNAAQSDGDDILFTSSDGITKLDHEIESYNSTAGELIAWVKIANLSSTTDTVIYMYYGNSGQTSSLENPDGVWNTNFVGVWHLNETGDGTADEYEDSSQYDNHGQGGEGQASYIPTRVAGKIGYAQDFNDDLIDVGNDSSLDITGNQITLEAWIQYPSATHPWMGFLNHKGWSEGYRIIMADNSQKMTFQLPGDSYDRSTAQDVSPNTWHHVVATYDGSIMKIYIDGSKDSNELAKSNNIISSSSEVWIGHGDQPKGEVWSYPWEGQIDEVRISDVARSADWIATEFNNQNDTSSFYTVGHEEINLDCWLYRKPITINSSQVAGDLTDFPILINILDSDIQNKACSDGFDIVFTESDGITRLDHEIERYNSSSGELVAWAKIPDLSSSSDMLLYMYYGNSAITFPTENPIEVWDDNYMMVQHLNETSKTAGTYNDHLDSTSNDNDGEAENGVTMDATGKIDGADDFDANNDYIDLGSDPSLDLTTVFTVEAWINLNGAGGYQTIYTSGTESDNYWEALIESDALSYRDDISGSYYNAGTTLTSGVWYHVAIVKNGDAGTNMNFYLDGKPDGTASVGSALSSGTKYIGARNEAGITHLFDGILDEVRISNKARSAEWINTSYLNQEVPGAFYSIGNEETNHNYDDVIIGAHGYNGDKGRAYIFFGDPSFSRNLSAGNADVIIDGGASGDRFGWDVSKASDVNDDGFNDMIFGAPGYNSNAGSAYLFYGDDALPSITDVASADVKLNGENSGDEFGHSVSYAKDVNNDGYDDVIIGSPGYNSSMGAAYIFFGNDSFSNVLNASDANLSINGKALGDRFGYSVFYAGDINSDGISDVVIGAPYFDNGPFSDAGAVYVFEGGISMDNITDWAYYGEFTNDHLGWSVSYAGDVNSDGFNEIIVGAPKNDEGGINGGKIYLLTTIQLFTISNIIATPSIVEPGGYVNITCTVIGPLGIGAVWVNITLPGGGYTNVTLTQGIGNTWYFNNTYLTQGTYQFTLWANDILGNWTKSSIFQFEVLNNPPILSTPQVNPAVGYIDSDFNFTVNYTDLDDHAPYNITLNISGVGVYDLIEADSLDLIYDDGKLYFYNISGYSVGQYSFHFATNDSFGNWTETGILQFDVINREPTLSLVQVNPSSGNVDSWFNFTVTYTDLDNHAPDIILLNITGLGVYGVLEVDALDTDYTDGKQYYSYIAGFAVGNYPFNFIANDTLGNWTESTFSQFDVINRAPTFSSLQVSPSTGYVDTWFNFTAIYTDLDNHTPYIFDLDITGYGVFGLIEADALDTDYTDGKLYYYNISGFSIGNHSYHFEANDTIGSWVVSETIQFYVINRGPALSIEDLDPGSGFVDTLFNFSVNYTDLDDHVPDIITVNITGYGNMVLFEVDSLDTDLTDGKRYYRILTGFTVGTHNYHFAANDTFGNWTESANFQFDIFNRPPSFSSPQVNPIIGYTDTGFNFTVTYTDLDNHAPDIITVNITGVGVYPLNELDPLDTDYTDGKLYYFNTTGFPQALYSFNFAANDTLGDWIESGILQFDVINRGAQLFLEQVSPTFGYIDSDFNFTVTYINLDNYSPDIITLNITGFGVYPLNGVDSFDLDYTDGKLYYYNMSGISISQYFFHFAANFTGGNWTETGILQFDVINRDPILSLCQVNPIMGYTDMWYNFTVVYTDLDNHPPNSFSLDITGFGTFSPLETDALDTDFTDGKLYYFNTTGFPLGTFSFHFETNDIIGNWTISGVSQFDVVNRIPTLSGSQVNPLTGFIDTWFNYSVTYTDLDDNPPDVITVNITGMGVYDLIEFDSLDMDYTDGKLYYLNMSGFSTGTHSFNFAANDTIGDWVESTTLQFDVVSRSAQLSMEQVNPTLGYIDTGFNFTVTYTHLDNYSPYLISVNITGLGFYPLNEVDSLDSDYTDGKLYYFNLSGFAISQYSFHFAANVTSENWAESGTLQFDVINRPPVLSSAQVDPPLGYIDTWFNFTATYTDLDNHTPATITLNITGLGIYVLNEVYPLDMDYSDGKAYYYNLSGFTVGQYSFNFAASDMIGEWAESGILQFETLNTAPTLVSESVDSLTGFPNTWFNFTVTYVDLDNQAPDVITVNITGYGLFNLVGLDQSDLDFTDGKEYYFNTTIPVGSYSFHFAANDSLGLWGQETPEIIGLIITQNHGVLYAIDSSVYYGDEINLNAVLLDDDTNPIPGEIVDFYLDLNNNGIYETEECAGSQTTQLDGRVTVTYTSVIDSGTYNFTVIYNISGNIDVDSDFGLLTVNPKQATLTAISNLVEVGETTYLNATLMDVNSNPIEGEQVAFYLDRNGNGIYEGSDFIVGTMTSSYGVVSVNYFINLNPGNYGIWAKYLGSSNYVVNEIEGLLTVQKTGNIAPIILWNVPDQIKPEDSPPWILDLTSHEMDNEDSGIYLNWYLTDVDSTFYTVIGMNSSNDELTFIPHENGFGSDEVILWLVDSSGDKDSQMLWINITPVNDLPYFDPLPPDIFVHYDDPSTSDDDPSPWDYSFYVHDIETPLDELILTTSQPSVDSGDGYVEVDGLQIAFHYPQSRVGESILITLSLSDGTDITQTMIRVNVTSDWVPELVAKIPDVVLQENSTLYNVFDLDDYFRDRDNDSLFFTSGYFNIKVDINDNNTVDITAQGQWTGEEYVTFRAEDPIGAISEDTITVTVIPVNDAPVISGVPDLFVHYDYSYAFDISPYISDLDNPLSDLVVWTSELTDNIRLQQSNNLGIIILYPESMNGMTIPTTIYVSDGMWTASQQINITVTNNFPPELAYNLPDVFFDEDTILNGAFTLNDYFFDIDDNVLFYTNGSKFINITINEDLTVDFSAPENWYGSEFITFRATDPKGALAEDKILVVVVPVNDPPNLREIPGQEKDEGDEWILDLSLYIEDVDNDLSELIITVESEAGQSYVNLVGNILIFNYPKGIREDTITISVSDGEQEIQRSFTVDIHKPVQIAPNIWDLIPWPWVISIIVVAIGGAFAIYKKKSKYQVYEAFLIHEKGLPMAHVSQEEISELEDVVVSGMFTAVQDFINDAFSGNSSDAEWELDEMKFGEHKILIERTKNLYLAVIFEGYGPKLRSRVKKLLEDINDQYGQVIEHWEGDIAEIKGIKAMIVSLIPDKTENVIESKGESEPSQQESKNETFKNPLMDLEDKDDIRECPVCGSVITTELTKCPDCGIEFVELKEISSHISSSLNIQEKEPENSEEGSHNPERQE